MALSGDGMAGEVKAALQGVGLKFLSDAELKAICGAIVSHFQQNAEVLGGITSKGTVESGQGAGGAVTVTSQPKTMGLR